jgi:hypothetical protein
MGMVKTSRAKAQATKRAVTPATLPAASGKRMRAERARSAPTATVHRLRSSAPAVARKPSLPPHDAPANVVMTGTTTHTPIAPPPAVLMPDLERLRQAPSGIRKGADEAFDLRLQRLLEWQAANRESLVRTRGSTYFLTAPGRQWLEAWYSQTGYHHLLPVPKTTGGRKPASETLVGASFISRYQLNRLAVRLGVTQQDMLATLVEDAYRQMFPEG